MATVGVSKRPLIPLLFVLCSILSFLSSRAVDTLRPGESLRATDTLVSSGGVFELGFFSPGGNSSSNHYLGIWLKNDPNKKPVWVANRDYPILDPTGVLTIRSDGNLVITDRRGVPIIINPGMLAATGNTSAKLFDSGNFVLTEGEMIVWESFYYPSDTFLPGMKLGWFNLATGPIRQQYLVSWKGPSDPATGSFSFALYRNNRTQLKVWFGESGASQSIGFWDGQSFKFLYESSPGQLKFSYVSNLNETYLTFNTSMNNRISWFVVTSSWEISEFTMIGQEIRVMNYSFCEDSLVGNATECFKTIPSLCQDGDKFSEINGLKPNSRFVSESVQLGLSDCEKICRNNCSCTAFASFRDEGTRCALFYGDKNLLLDIKREGNGTIYIRGEFPPKKSDKWSKERLWLIVIVLVIVSLVMPIVASLVYYLRRKRKKDRLRRSLELFLFQFGAETATTDIVDTENNVEFVRRKDHELPLLSFSCIATATDNFSAANKLGEGGYGPVYKGMLLGHEIAVKRLSRRSGQGLEEFKNEVHLISKLQHRNLVKLLGCCIQREEKILIYEYLPNKSLDFFLFDANKRALLDWEKRTCIIEGIAQGLLYLHKYSRLRIIHRDLKPSNILLDGHMTPKISDFGMARIFREDEVRAKTTRVVGTYGYMSPEYAVHGLFSIKSDVFSFGVIMLEIISGKRNTTFHQSDHSLNLLGYAWDLWKDGRGLELMDPTMADSCSISEVMLCIQVGLLCVQESPEDRPTMSDVVSMICNEGANLSAPKQPAFPTQSPSRRQPTFSLNDATVSSIEAR